MTTTSVTLRATGLVLLLVVLFALAFVLGGVARDDGRAVASVASVAAVPADERLGTITMTGTGEVTGVPDQMTFRVAVTRTAADVATAMDHASTSMRRVLDALRRAGVDRKDTETTGLSVDPEYRYHATAPPELTGYRVRQSISVLVRDLPSGGEAVAAAVRAGGNAVRVNGIGLRIGDQDALMARARDAAVNDATTRAAQYAEATGRPLGQVLTVREGRLPGRTQPVTQLARGYDARDSAAPKAVPLRAGRTDLAVRVTVVWALAE